jgi:hypothetical protein
MNEKLSDWMWADGQSAFQTRMYQRDYRDFHALEPDPAYVRKVWLTFTAERHRTLCVGGSHLWLCAGG